MQVVAVVPGGWSAFQDTQEGSPSSKGRLVLSVRNLLWRASSSSLSYRWFSWMGLSVNTDEAKASSCNSSSGQQ